MQFLLDTSPRLLKEQLPSPFVMGQLQTPLTGYKYAGTTFAIDNGAFSRFNSFAFKSVLNRHKAHAEQCLFVAMPDVVGNARRTLEIWQHRRRWVDDSTWPLALVAQDGIEDLPIPWDEFEVLFIGGSTDFKLSGCVRDLIKTAHTLERLVHVGRVNTPERFKYFVELGAYTCDGTGICKSQFRKLRAIEEYMIGREQLTLFNTAAQKA